MQRPSPVGESLRCPTGVKYDIALKTKLLSVSGKPQLKNDLSVSMNKLT